MSIGLAFARRFAWADVPRYTLAQVLGATVAGGELLVIANGTAGFDIEGGFATNGYGDRSPGGYGLGAVLLTESSRASDP